MRCFVFRGLEGSFEDVEVGARCIVAHCGSGKSYFGEFGTVTKELKNHLVITTDSGTIVKVDDMFRTVGKAKKAGYFASLKTDNREDMIHQRVHYWNDEKCRLEYK